MNYCTWRDWCNRFQILYGICPHFRNFSIALFHSTVAVRLQTNFTPLRLLDRKFYGAFLLLWIFPRIINAFTSFIQLSPHPWRNVLRIHSEQDKICRIRRKEFVIYKSHTHMLIQIYSECKNVEIFVNSVQFTSVWPVTYREINYYFDLL